MDPSTLSLGLILALAFIAAAEAQIPLAMAEAFRNGNLGVMDYQRYRNVQADTTMRQGSPARAMVPAGAPDSWT